MNEKEVIEGNKLIAEFMKLPLIECRIATEEGAVTRGYLHPSTNSPYTIKGLQYLYKWSWLMPVVEKIETLDELGGIVNISQGQCKITSRALGDSSVYANTNYYLLMGAKGKLNATYEAIVTFIKWYNENKLKE